MEYCGGASFYSLLCPVPQCNTTTQDVLTLHRDYFRLGKPLERRVYELARKHCGRKNEFTISVSVLHKKSGSQSPVEHFRGMVKEIAARDHLPDYRVAFKEETDNVTFYNRERWWEETPVASNEETLPALPSESYDEARAAAPGYDVYQLESEWREFWVLSGKPKLANVAAAFVGFCRHRNKKSTPPAGEGHGMGEVNPLPPTSKNRSTVAFPTRSGGLAARL